MISIIQEENPIYSLYDRYIQPFFNGPAISFGEEGQHVKDLYHDARDQYNGTYYNHMIGDIARRLGSVPDPSENVSLDSSLIPLLAGEKIKEAFRNGRRPVEPQPDGLQMVQNDQPVVAAESVEMDRDTMNLAYNYCRGELKNDIDAFGGRHAKKIISEVVNFVKNK